MSYVVPPTFRQAPRFGPPNAKNIGVLLQRRAGLEQGETEDDKG